MSTIRITTADMERLQQTPFRDQITFEEFTGLPFTGLASLDVSAIPTRVLVGLIWLVRHRDDPAFTLEQALDLDYTAIDFSDDGPNPTEAAPAPLEPLAASAPRRRRASA